MDRVNKFVAYCIRNELCTKMSISQYNLIQDMIYHKSRPTTDIALLVWFNSDESVNLVKLSAELIELLGE